MHNALAEQRDEKSGVLGVVHETVEAVGDEPVFLPVAVQFAPAM
jgi:hypothetical protein